MIYAYARCSLDEHKQDIQRQTRELKEADAESICWEFQHGDSKDKKALNALLDEMQAGDTLITLEVSRLSHSTQQLREIIDVIRNKRLRLVIVNSITIDCRDGKIDPMSETFMNMAGVFSELELQMIRSRIHSGMQNAKAKSKQIGRKSTTKEDIPAVFYNTTRPMRSRK